jgi:hypothetical protein
LCARCHTVRPVDARKEAVAEQGRSVQRTNGVEDVAGAAQEAEETLVPNPEYDLIR